MLNRLMAQGREIKKRPGKSDGPSGQTSGSSAGQPLKWFPEHRRSEWFREHYDQAAGEVVEFLADEGIQLRGKMVTDVGCGDGIIDLGLASRESPASLVGFDPRPTDVDLLLNLAEEHAVGGEMPGNLEFRTSGPAKLPAPDDTFDVAISWSAFEHVEEPVSLIREVRRILKPEGFFMIQLYPFFHSENGSHLWEWFPDGFTQFLHTDDEIDERIKTDPGPDPEWAKAVLWVYRRLNRITLDELQRCLLAGGFRVSRLELITESVLIPFHLSRYPVSLLGVAGVKLLAVPL